MDPKKFLSDSEQKQIVDAIIKAEKNTSGEIRLHIDSVCEGPAYDKAVKIFNYLGMEGTAQRNAVLIYLACESKVFAIIGDKGINEVVPENFWNDILLEMKNDFSKGHFASGLIKAIEMTGNKLCEFFPYTTDDINEQSDEISFEKK